MPLQLNVKGRRHTVCLLSLSLLTCVPIPLTAAAAVYASLLQNIEAALRISDMSDKSILCRVNDKNQDHFGSNGAQWPENESAWDSTGSNRENGFSAPAVKHKKAWDWDADW